MSTKTRKTLDRENVIARANAALDADIDGTSKVAIFVVTNGMLLTGNSYKGFRAVSGESDPEAYRKWKKGVLDVHEAIREGMVVRFL